MTDDDKLDHMIRIAVETGSPLDHVVAQMRDLDQSEFLAVSDNPSRLPRYTKSSVKP